MRALFVLSAFLVIAANCNVCPEIEHSMHWSGLGTEVFIATNNFSYPVNFEARLTPPEEGYVMRSEEIHNVCYSTKSFTIPAKYQAPILIPLCPSLTYIQFWLNGTVSCTRKMSNIMLSELRQNMIETLFGKQ